MPYYSDISTPSSAKSLLLSGPYANHSSIIASNYIPYSKPLPRQFRGGYKPQLTTISELSSPLRRVNSPNLYHSSPKVNIKPIKIIDTADIDVSVNKYRKFSKYDRSKPEILDLKPLEKSPSPKTEQIEPKEAKPNPTIRRERATVRIKTVHEDTVENEIKEIKSWRDNFREDELIDIGEKRERKTPGEILKEKFLIRSKSKENIPKGGSCSKRRKSISKSPSFRDICRAITTDDIDDELNPGQPLDVQIKQSRQVSTEDIIKHIRRTSSQLTEEDLDILDTILLKQESEEEEEEPTAGAKKKKIARKRTEEILLNEDTITDSKSERDCRGTVKKKKSSREFSSADNISSLNGKVDDLGNNVCESSGSIERRNTEQDANTLNESELEKSIPEQTPSRTNADKIVNKSKSGKERELPKSKDLVKSAEPKRHQTDKYVQGLCKYSSGDVHLLENMSHQPGEITKFASNKNTSENFPLKVGLTCEPILQKDDIMSVSGIRGKEILEEYNYKEVIPKLENLDNESLSSKSTTTEQSVIDSNPKLAREQKAPIASSEKTHQQNEDKILKSPLKDSTAQCKEEPNRLDQNDGGSIKNAALKGSGTVTKGVAEGKGISLDKPNSEESIPLLKRIASKSDFNKTVTTEQSIVDSQPKSLQKRQEINKPDTSQSLLPTTKRKILQKLEVKKPTTGKTVQKEQNANLNNSVNKGQTQQERNNLDKIFKSSDVRSNNKMIDKVESSNENVIKDISQVDIEEKRFKPKPIITATVGEIDEKRPPLKAVVDDVEVVESPKKKEKKFRFNLTVEVKAESPKMKFAVENGVVEVPKPKEPVVIGILKRKPLSLVGQVLEEKEREAKAKKIFKRQYEADQPQKKKVISEESSMSSNSLLPSSKSFGKRKDGISTTKQSTEITVEGIETGSTNNPKIEVITPKPSILQTDAAAEIKKSVGKKTTLLNEPCRENQCAVPNSVSKVSKESSGSEPNYTTSLVSSTSPVSGKNSVEKVKKTTGFPEKIVLSKNSAENLYTTPSPINKLFKHKPYEIEEDKEKLSKSISPLTTDNTSMTDNKPESTKIPVKDEVLTDQNGEALRGIEDKSKKTSVVNGEVHTKLKKKIIKNKFNELGATPCSPSDKTDDEIKVQRVQQIEEKSEKASIVNGEVETKPKKSIVKSKVNESTSVSCSRSDKTNDNRNEEVRDDTIQCVDDKQLCASKEENKVVEETIAKGEGGPLKDETSVKRDKKQISKRSLVNKADKDDPDLQVFVPPEPEPEPEPEDKDKFVPLQTNRLTQWMIPWKKPEQFDVCPVEIWAKPKVIRGRHYPRPRGHPAPGQVSEDGSTEDESDSEDETSTAESTSSSESSSGEEGCEGGTTKIAGASTSSVDSGFGSGAACKKESSDSRDSPSTSPLANNSEFAIDADTSIPEELAASSTYASFHKTGRITPPATTIPRFKKYTVDDFNFLKVLGKGSFGKVLLAELKGTEYYYAVKCLKKDVVLEDDDIECTLIERKVLALGTKHPYLCHLLCTFQTDSHLFFVMEYLNGGDLMFHIQASGRFPEYQARFYGAEIVSGLKFLHTKGIVYRDLKLDNVLLDFDGHVRIADFGMCKLQIFLDRMAESFCGTPDYMAPEIIKGQHYNQCVDWWSFGVLLYEMLSGTSPFSGCDEDELFWSICNEKPVIPAYISPEAKNILLLLLEKDASKRLGNRFCTHGDIQDHDFFKKIDWYALEARQLEPPFKPYLQHPLDTSYFDKHFTAEKAKLTPVDPTILESIDQTQFQGFSYTNPNATDK